MKQLKKAGKQTPEKETSEEVSGKKSGWKNVLEQMLEEARKQMENQAEPESAGTPPKYPNGKQPTGWEDIITEKRPLKRKRVVRSEKTGSVRPYKEPLIPDDIFSGKAKFQPECMRCNESMKEITDLGTGRQSGLIYCDSCGEQHKYEILNGELKLKQADAVRKKSATAPERRYRQVDEDRKAKDTISAANIEVSALPAGEIEIPRQMSIAGLRTAVVWSEILGKPLGLRDIEV